MLSVKHEVHIGVTIGIDNYRASSANAELPVQPFGYQ